MRRLAILLVVLSAAGCSFVESDGSAFNSAHSGGAGGTTGGTTGGVDRCAGVSCPAEGACMVGTCVDGGCTYAANLGAPCDDSNPCTTSDQCLSDAGCMGFPDPDAGACDDGQACTMNDHCVDGVCEGSSYTCTPDTTACQTKSVCDGDGGCIVTPKNDGETCASDSNPCTSDVCDSGVCDHPVNRDGTFCGNGLTCSGGVCQGVCVVGATTYDAGAINPGNECQSCQPGASTSAWSPLASGTPCQDGGNPCKISACDGLGECTGNQNQPDGNSCADGGVCQNGSCILGCYIGGAVVTSGTYNSADDCQWCQSMTSTNGWTNVANNTACTTNGGPDNGKCESGTCLLNFGEPCSVGSQCQSGRCNATDRTGAKTCTASNISCPGCTYYSSADAQCHPVIECVSCPNSNVPPTMTWCDGAGTCTNAVRNTCQTFGTTG